MTLYARKMISAVTVIVVHHTRQKTALAQANWTMFRLKKNLY